MSVKNILSLIAFYLVTGLALWAAAVCLTNGDRSVIGKGIAGMGIAFSLLAAGELALAGYVRRRNPDFLVSVFIGAKTVRLLLTLFAITVYGLLGAPEFIVFSLNIVVFYMATLVYTTVFNMQKNKQ